MNGAASNGWRRRARTASLRSAIAVFVLFIVSRQDAARGWLIAFSVFSQIVLGSLALLLLHELTSTRWGVAFGPGAEAAVVGRAAASGVFLRHRPQPAQHLPIGRLAGLDPSRCGGASI